MQFNSLNYRQSTAVTSAINSLNSNTSLSAEEKRRVLEEEAKTLEQFKVITTLGCDVFNLLFVCLRSNFTSSDLGLNRAIIKQITSFKI